MPSHGANAEPKPVVSVVMCFLDAERYIAEAIESVRAQTLDDWELILVDDGSADGTRCVADAFAARDPARIRVLEHSGRVNRGLAVSRNLGMASARGRYLAFLDADDLYEPARLERHVRELERDPRVGVVLSADLYWHEWQPPAPNAPRRRDQRIVPAVDPGRRIEAPVLIVATLLTPRAPMPAICSVTFRAEAFRKLGGAPEHMRGHYEDQVLICKLLLSWPAIVVEETLARYRQRPDSLTAANAQLEAVSGSDAWQGRLNFLEWLGRYLLERDLELPQLAEWTRQEAGNLRKGTQAGRRSRRSRPLFAVARWINAALLPATWQASLETTVRRYAAIRVRQKVRRRVAEFEQPQVDLDRVIRTYWDERIDDTPLSGDAPGTAGFFAVRDSYRLRKNPYLARAIDFAGWAGREVLEIGCGMGLDLLRFARGGARVSGVDVSEQALRLARDYCRVTGVEATLLEADGAELPFPDAAFDFVYCHGVLSFVRNPVRVIGEAYRVLRPGGQALLMVYNRRSWMQWLLRTPGAPIGQGHADAPAFRTYDRREFEQMLAPFHVERIEVERPPPMPALLRPVADRWLRPMGWHLLAYCRKPA